MNYFAEFPLSANLDLLAVDEPTGQVVLADFNCPGLDRYVLSADSYRETVLAFEKLTGSGLSEIIGWDYRAPQTRMLHIQRKLEREGYQFVHEERHTLGWRAARGEFSTDEAFEWRVGRFFLTGDWKPDDFGEAVRETIRTFCWTAVLRPSAGFQPEGTTYGLRFSA